MNKDMLVKQARIDDRIIDLAFDREHSGSYFTVIVGKNGSGKSRLLREISLDVFEPSIRKKVICISNGYFHKFVTANNYKNNVSWEDCGYRNLCLSDSFEGHFVMGDGFSNVFNREIISALFGSADTRLKTLKLLRDFNFFDGVSVSISLYSHIGEFDGEGIRFDRESLGMKLVASVNKYDVIDEELSKIHENINLFIKSSNYIEMIKGCKLCQVDGVDKKLLQNSCLRNHDHFLSFDFDVNSDSKQAENMPDEFINALLFLNKYRLITVRQLVFKKGNNVVNMKELSSGELSVLLCILKINSEIEDGSLILIDEPELSLHPAWQSKIIPSINECFSSYRGCHFIIATHSPLVVSSIPEHNSAIVILDEETRIIPGEKSHRKSADYQLFTVLGYAGDQNEYIKRRFMIMMSKLSTGVDLSSNELLFIEKAQNLLEDADEEDFTKYLLNQVVCLLHGV